MRRALAVAPVLLAAACFDPSFNNPRCGAGESCPADHVCDDGICRLGGAPDAEPSTIDASLVDATPFDAEERPDAPAGQCADWTFTPSNVPCIDPIGAWSVGANQTYNTDTGTSTVSGAPVGAVVTQNDGTTARVVSLNDFTIINGVALQVRGSLPLIVLVDGTAAIQGYLDLVGALGVAAAGSNSSLCVAGNSGGAGETDSMAGGGGGGGFGGGGASGGMSSDGVGASGPAGGTGGNATLTPLRGGCRGGNGGTANGTGGGAGGVGGASGGAVQIAARTSIAIAGAVGLGGGSGGFGRPQYGGGGGGGSGGALLLEAPSVEVTGSLCANGGAGGEGAGQGQDGFGGESGKCSGAAGGGSGGSDGGAGGNGSYQTTGPTPGSNGPTNPILGGGGGGGGGAGRITIRGTRTGTANVISPAATSLSL